MSSAVRRRDHDDSGEYSDGSQDIDHNSLNDGVHHESDYESQGSESERSERDPDSQETERRVDDDEDRSNPQYIPKRGTFYEHDDRTAASGEESNNTTSEVASDKKEGVETPAERRRPPRKSDIINKWSHDKYNENEQTPKSREELVAIYGYDIRNEDAPPHARRNRRYGRGPNKYTRTWEDEEAYRRQSAAQAQQRKPPNPEDFPELEAAAKKHGKKTRTPRPRSKSQPASNESSEKSVNLRRNASIKIPKTKPAVKPALNKTAPVKNVPTKPAKENNIKLPALENLTITASINNSQGQPLRRVSATVAQQRPVPTEQANKKPIPTQMQQQSSPSLNKPQQQQQPQHPSQQQKPQNQQPQQQTAGAESRGGSKRYSSLRQRPLAESYTPQQQNQQQPQPQQQQQQSQPQSQQQQPAHRYHSGPNEYATTNQHQPSPPTHPHPQHMMHQQVLRPQGVGHAPSPPHQPAHNTQQVRLGLLEQPPLVSHAHHNLHNMPNMPNMPAHNIGQLQPSQGYAPPAMMPTQYMQSGSGAVICSPAMYGQPPAPPYQHQIYQHHNYATQAGGVTYYNCAEQPEQPPRTQRRPTAAIPIVRPQVPDRPANSTEKDNIDRIVENMFVRKPWPATHGTDKEKSQSEARSSQEPQSKESSQPNSLTSSSISIESKPSEQKEEEEKHTEVHQEIVTTDA